MDINYTPINYNTWDFSGQGKNILPLLTEPQRIAWERALPYQDTRRGEKGHAEVATCLSLKFMDLLEQYTDLEFDRDVVLAYIINHDNGWSQVSQTERDLFYVEDLDPTTGKAVWERYEPILRARHQELGVELAKTLLEEQGFPPSLQQRQKVYQGIGQHDTGKKFLSVEDEIMKSSDRGWRYTLPCIKIAREERGWSEAEMTQRLNAWLEDPNFLSHDLFREAARQEWASAIAAYKAA